jgi:predicted glycogen debranching enzyme
MPKICMGTDQLSDFNTSIKLEWLITNGLGGYASSTVLGINTRKYHGLLIAAFSPPTDRNVLLSKIDVELWVQNKKFHLANQEYLGVIHPQGFKHLTRFTLSPFPTFFYEVNGIYLQKILFMPHLKNAVIASYDVNNCLNKPIQIKISPQINSRSFYHITDRFNKELVFRQENFKNGFKVEVKDKKSHFYLTSTEGKFISDDKAKYWIDRAFFRVDASRGESCFDDNYVPGVFIIHIKPNEKKQFYISAFVEKDKTEDSALFSILQKNEVCKTLYFEELERKHDLLNLFFKQNPEVKVKDWIKLILLSMDHFIVLRNSTRKKSIIAGYHWFEDWGRDALISLPGLTLVTGRFEDAKDVLLTFKNYCNEGMMPNKFPDRDGDQPIYNTVDASLWYVYAVYQFLKYTGDFDFVYQELWITMKSIIDNYADGTLFKISMDDDGLIKNGPQLTWMDAIVSGKPATPRKGKTVEIQALWYNALRIMSRLAEYYFKKKESDKYRLMAKKVYKNFNKKFWDPQQECLIDTLNNGEPDYTIRPNQVFALSLDFSLLDFWKMDKIMHILWSKLWGTYGLKTLVKDDPRYYGKYVGGLISRDAAYHNGTIWAWLVGPFVTAFLKTKKYTDYWRKFAFDNFLQPLFLDELYRFGLGEISEIFDGDLPHKARGCIAQAWSIAEPFRAFVEDILLKRPPFESFTSSEIQQNQ